MIRARFCTALLFLFISVAQTSGNIPTEIQLGTWADETLGRVEFEIITQTLDTSSTSVIRTQHRPSGRVVQITVIALRNPEVLQENIHSLVASISRCTAISHLSKKETVDCLQSEIVKFQQQFSLKISI